MRIMDITHPPKAGLWVGRESENRFRPVSFECANWFEAYPNATIVAYYQPYAASDPYPLVLTADGTKRIWHPTVTELVKGNGELQIVLMLGDVVGTSAIIPTRVDRSLISSADHPADEAPSWTVKVVQDVTEQADRAEEAASHYPKIVNGVWHVWSVQDEDYVSTGIEAQGEDGYSTTVMVTEIEGGHRVTITDATHPQGQSFDVMDGTDEQTAQAVSEWLDEHPEATTTVDYKITTKTLNTVDAMIGDTTLEVGDNVRTNGYYSTDDGGAAIYKIEADSAYEDNGEYIALQNGLVAKLIWSREINALQFGFKPDDAMFDNDAIMSKYVQDCTRPIHFPDGTYTFSQPIELSDCFVSMSDLAVLKYIGESADYFVGVFSEEQILSRNSGYRHFTGGSIDATNCKVGIAYRFILGIVFENLNIKKFTEVGLYCNYTKAGESIVNSGGSNVYINNLKIIGLHETLGDIGINAARLYDSHISNVEIVETQYGIKTCGGDVKFYGIHHWVTEEEKYKGSATFYNDGPINHFSAMNSTFDTVRSALKCTSYAQVSLIGFVFFSNTLFIDDEITQTYPMVVFDIDSNDGMLYSRINAIGQIDGSGCYGKVFPDAYYTFLQSVGFRLINISLITNNVGNFTNYSNDFLRYYVDSKIPETLYLNDENKNIRIARSGNVMHAWFSGTKFSDIKSALHPLQPSTGSFRNIAFCNSAGKFASLTFTQNTDISGFVFNADGTGWGTAISDNDTIHGSISWML